MNKKLLSHLLLIFLFSLIAGFNLFKPGYFTMHDDLQVMRLYEMDRCLQDGQIPCRWSPDMDAGYGQPMFNFYSAFPYYLGGTVKLLGFSFLDSVKILMFLCILASGIFSYLFFLEILAPLAALVGAVAYIFIPYRALDIFVRGALSESWALALLPAVLATTVSTVKDPKPYKTVLLALSVGALFSTHNITTMTSAPFIILLALFYLFNFGASLKKIFHLVVGAVLGFGLSAFFLLPVLFEKDLVHTEYLISDYFNFQNHFTSIKLLFLDLHWGFGSESIGPGGMISFFIGFIPLIALVIFPVVIFFSGKIKKKGEYLLYYALALFALFMAHPRSFYIWNAIPVLQYVQFPWRFLGLFALFSSLTMAVIAGELKKVRWLPAILIILLIALNLNYFRFGRYLPDETDQSKLSGASFALQQRSALLDYLPKSAGTIPEEIAPAGPEVLEGRVSINYYDSRSGYFSSEFDVYSDTAKIRFPVIYFPGWELHQNRSPDQMSFDYDNDLGLITVELSLDHQLVQAFFENTPIRTLGNALTFASSLIILLWLAITYEKNKH